MPHAVDTRAARKKMEVFMVDGDCAFYEPIAVWKAIDGSSEGAGEDDAREGDVVKRVG